MAATIQSPRLQYHRLAAPDLSRFLVLMRDPYVRRFLLDGEIVDEAWCEQQLADSDELFAELGGGLWLLFPRSADGSTASADPLGMCGFIRFLETGSEPQLVYALRPEHTGRGYATEAARAVIELARDELGLSRLISAADEPNVRSIRVLEALGFVRSGHYPGTFGRILTFALPLERASR